jgi:hypothetical protein
MPPADRIALHTFIYIHLRIVLAGFQLDAVLVVPDMIQLSGARAMMKV